MHVIIAGSRMNGSTPEYLFVFVLAFLKWHCRLRLDSNLVASILAHNAGGGAVDCICGAYSVLN
jgi:hypothetical protein